MRRNILAKFLNCSVERIFNGKYDYHSYTDTYTDYLVLTEEEANEEAKKQVWSYIHSFHVDFLNKHLIKQIPEEQLSKLFSTHCDNCLSIITMFIIDYELFVQEAVEKYGRSYFICFEDKTEYRVKGNGILYYIYKLV